MATVSCPAYSTFFHCRKRNIHGHNICKSHLPIGYNSNNHILYWRITVHKDPLAFTEFNLIPHWHPCVWQETRHIYSTGSFRVYPRNLLDPVTSWRLVMMSVSFPADSKESAILAAWLISNSRSLGDPVAKAPTLTCNNIQRLKVSLDNPPSPLFKFIITVTVWLFTNTKRNAEDFNNSNLIIN